MSLSSPSWFARGLLALACCSIASALPVFPGAVGFGTQTVAGRGGQVYRVNNLLDDYVNPPVGSLRYGVEELSGPRVIIFEVSGVIELRADLVVRNDGQHSHLTIAGQTAPPPGITLRNGGIRIRTHDVLIQHIAIRVGNYTTSLAGWNLSPLSSRDCIGIAGAATDDPHNIVIDHVTATWSADGVNDVSSPNGAKPYNITFSNCILGRPILYAGHPKNDRHGFGTLLGENANGGGVNNSISLIRNLWAFNWARNPLIGNRNSGAQLVNNIIYRPGPNTFHGMWIGVANPQYPDEPMTVSAIGNLLIRHPEPIVLQDPELGPQTFAAVSTRAFQVASGGSGEISIYVNHNSLRVPSVGDPQIETVHDSNQWASPLYSEATPTTHLSSDPHDNSGGTTWTPWTANIEEQVLATVGKYPGSRDVYDSELISNVQNRTGTFLSQFNELGPNPWEPVDIRVDRELQVPANPNGDDDGNGYTNLEEWLHEFSLAVETPSGLPPSIDQWFEAESTSNQALFSPLAIGSDGAASGGQYISSPTSFLTTPTGSTTGQVTFTCTLSGTVAIWVRMYCLGVSEDSFWASYNGGAYASLYDSSAYGTWVWKKWGEATATGNNPFKIVRREANTRLDRVLFTTDLNFTPTGTGEDNPPDIITTVLPSGRTSISYGDQQLTATGGATPYSWSLSTGMLPDGLTGPTTGGVISGTPTTAGISNFTVRVTDAASQTDDQPLSITINTNSVPEITTTSLPNAPIDVAYNQSVSSSGGDVALVWSVDSGSLPAGLTLSNINSQNATISGTPTALGASNFILKLADVDNDSDTQALGITVTDETPPTVSITEPDDSATVSGASVTVSANASDNIGVAGVQFKLDGANLEIEDTTSPYSIDWDSTTIADGSHTLTAVARDAAGNTAVSSGITVNVGNAPAQGVWLESEGASGQGNFSPFTVESDATAGGGQYIVSATSSMASAPSTGHATFTNTLGGTAAVWFRMYCPNLQADSFWVKYGGGSFANFYNTGANNQWVWQKWGEVSGAGTLTIAYREANTRLDRVLFTNDLAFTPTGIGGASATEIWLQAEGASGQSLFSPFGVLSDAGASGGECIQVTTTNMTTPTDTTPGQALFTCPLSGTVAIWIRINFTSTSEDSVFVKYDTEAWSNYYNSASYGTWTWVKWGERAATGNDVFRIARREANSKVDRVLFTTDLNFTPTGSGP